jgi:hypothetical protein
MNSTRNSVAGVEVFDLTDNSNDLSSQSLPRIPNSLSRRYRQGGATFTANRHGVFEVRNADVFPMFFILGMLTFVSF